MSSDLKSTNQPYGINPLHYEKGSIINGGVKGIYCKEWKKIVTLEHEYSGPMLVVLEPANASCSYNHVALIGDVRVVNTIPWSSCEALGYRGSTKLDILNRLEAENEQRN